MLTGGNARFTMNSHILRLPELNTSLGTTVPVDAALPAIFLAQLFHNRSMDNSIKIEAGLSKQEITSLTISVEQRPEIQISLDVRESLTRNFLRDHLIKVELSRPDKKSIIASRLLLDENGMPAVELSNHIEPLFLSSIYLGRGYGNESTYAQRMGDVRRRKKGDLGFERAQDH